MAYAQFAGQGLWYPSFPSYFTMTPPALSTAMLLDGGTDKAAFCGRVWYPSRASTKDISVIHFRAGAITSDGSTFRVGLDAISTTTGPPYQPEGTNDQSGTALVSALSANAWNSISLSANRTVAFGAQLAVTFDYSAYTAASVVVSCLTSIQSGPYGDCGAVLSNGGAAFGAQIVVPNVVLECTDGTFATLDGVFPFSAIGTNTFHLTTATNDEFGLQFQVPFACKVDGAWFLMAAGASGDVEVLLYSTPGGTPAAMTGTPITLDEDDQTVVAGSTRPFFVPFSQEITLAANTDYALTVRPLTSTNHITYYFDVNDANHFTLHSGGTVCKEVFREGNAGAFAPSNTSKRRPFMGVRISSVSTGSATSGWIIGG